MNDGGYPNNQGASPDINAPKFTEGGKNEIRAISSGTQALAIAQRFQSEDGQGTSTTVSGGGTRDLRRARVLAAFNGDAPYSDSILKAKGQTWRYNVSFGYMEGCIGRATVPYNELVNGGNFVGSVDAELPDQKKDLLQKEFTNAVDAWGKWGKTTSRTIQDLLLYGWDTNIFPDDYTPWPIFISQRDSFVHQFSPNDVKDIDVFVWRKTYMIHELYERIADAESAEKAGWKVETARKALENAMPENTNPIQRGWQAVEEAIRGGSLYYSMTGTKVVDTYHVFARELSGKVTHFIVLNSQSGDATKEAAAEMGDGPTLFKREDRFDGFPDFLVYFDLEPGDGKWHGSRGLGQRAFNTHRAIDKLRCSILDQAFTSGLTLLQPADESSQIDLQLSVIGPFAVIPAGINVNATTLPTLSATTFQADSLLLATAEQRIGDVLPESRSAVTGGDKTATQSRIDANQAAAVGRSNLLRFIDPISDVLSIMLRRLLKENSPNEDAQKFQKKLLAQGITREDMAKIRGAKTTGQVDDVLGETSVVMDQVYALFKGDPDIDQIELKRRVLRAKMGAKASQGLLIDKGNDVQKITDIRDEKNIIASIVTLGEVIPAAPNDNHILDLQTIIQWIDSQLQATKNGGNAASPKSIDLVGQHAVQHLKFMEADKQLAKLVGSFEKTLKEQLGAVEAHYKASVEQANRLALNPQPVAA